MTSSSGRTGHVALSASLCLAVVAACTGGPGIRGVLRSADEAGFAYHASYTRTAFGRTAYWYESVVVEASRIGEERCERRSEPSLRLVLSGYDAEQAAMCDEVLAYLAGAHELYGGGVAVTYELSLVGEPGPYRSETYDLGDAPVTVSLAFPNAYEAGDDDAKALPASAFHEMKHTVWALGGATTGADQGEQALEEISVQLLTHCASAAHSGRIEFSFDPDADQAMLERGLAGLAQGERPGARAFDLLYREGASFLLRAAGVPSPGSGAWLSRTCRDVADAPYALRAVIAQLLGEKV